MAVYVKSQILTGRTKYRQALWTGRPILQVEVLTDETVYEADGNERKVLRWRDARWEDLNKLKAIRKMDTEMKANLPGRKVAPKPPQDWDISRRR